LKTLDRENASSSFVAMWTTATATEWPTDAWLRLPLVAFASAHVGAVRDDETTAR
jgi:hypothetical protein